MYKRLIVILGLAVLAPGAFAADGPSSRPAGPGHNLRPFGGPDRRPNPGSRREEQPRWEEVEGFYREHCPHFYAAFEKLGPGEQKKWKEFYTRRYMGVRSPEREGDSELAAVKLRQIEIEDAIFGVRMNMIRSGGAPEAAKARLHDDLKKLVKERIEARIEERALRVVRMRKFLEEEDQRLAAERSKIDQLTDRQMESEMKSLPGAMGRDPRWRKRDDDDRRPPRDGKGDGK